MSLHDLIVGAEQTLYWLVIVAACTILLAGIWAVVETCLTYGRSRVTRRSSPVVPPVEEDARVRALLQDYAPRSFSSPAAKGFQAGYARPGRDPRRI